MNHFITLILRPLENYEGADPLVPIEAGRDTASNVPGAELLVIEGMGHELPPRAWPRVVGAIADHAQKAALGS